MAKKVKKDGRGNTKAIKPHSDYFYIVRIYKSPKGFVRLGVVKKHYQFREQALASIKRVIPKKDWIKFEVIRGDEVLYYGLKFRTYSLFQKLTKHDYPPELNTLHKRKAFRLQCQRLMAKGIVLKGEDYNYETKKEIQEKRARKAEEKKRKQAS